MTTVNARRTDHAIQIALLAATVILMLLTLSIILDIPAQRTATAPRPIIKVDPPVTADPNAKLFFERPMVRSN